MCAPVILLYRPKICAYNIPSRNTFKSILSLLIRKQRSCNDIVCQDFENEWTLIAKWIRHAWFGIFRGANWVKGWSFGYKIDLLRSLPKTLFLVIISKLDLHFISKIFLIQPTFKLNLIPWNSHVIHACNLRIHRRTN